MEEGSLENIHIYAVIFDNFDSPVHHKRSIPLRLRLLQNNCRLILPQHTSTRPFCSALRLLRDIPPETVLRLLQVPGKRGGKEEICLVVGRVHEGKEGKNDWEDVRATADD